MAYANEFVPAKVSPIFKETYESVYSFCHLHMLDFEDLSSLSKDKRWETYISRMYLEPGYAHFSLIRDGYRRTESECVFIQQDGFASIYRIKGPNLAYPDFRRRLPFQCE